MNPELRRLLWLEATAQRLWLIPLALIGTSFVLGRAVPALVPGGAMLGFVATTILWGASQARNAVLDEVREHTWDIQRMAALSAWSMTWGKLLGATLMPWYAGAIWLGILFGWRGERDLGEFAITALALVLAALLAQALALTSAIVTAHRVRDQRARLSIALALLLLALVLPPTFALVVPPGSLLPVAAVTWFGHAVATTTFMLTLLALLAAWAVLGAYRAMCIELDIRTTPWAWLAFVLFLALLLAGLAPPPQPALIPALCSAAALFAALLAYVAGFAFARDPVQVRRVLHALADGDARRALEALPLAASSLAIALAFGLIATLGGADAALSNERADNLGGVALAFALFALRDLALLAAFSYG
ncbi:MAG: hypothetical protein RKL32_03940, partial [Gammaproteobacteria bacterium]